jgi:hypothetical protein
MTHVAAIHRTRRSRKCPRCEKRFMPVKNEWMCSDECRRAARRATHNRYRLSHLDAVRALRAAWRRRQKSKPQKKNNFAMNVEACREVRMIDGKPFRMYRGKRFRADHYVMVWVEERFEKEEKAA